MDLNNKFFMQVAFLFLVWIQFENCCVAVENFFANFPNERVLINDSGSRFEPVESAGHQGVSKGVLQAKSTIEDLPAFRIYFDGKVAISDDNGFYSFPVDDLDMTKYRLVITRRLQHVFNKGNTLDAFRLIPEKNYACYTFKKLGRYGSWVKMEKRLNHKRFILPKRSIVVLINPKYVARVEEWNAELSKNVLKLPKIVLKSSVSEKELRRVAAKSVLYLEDAVFHEKVGRHSVVDQTKNGKIKVTLP